MYHTHLTLQRNQLILSYDCLEILVVCQNIPDVVFSEGPVEEEMPQTDMQSYISTCWVINGSILFHVRRFEYRHSLALLLLLYLGRRMSLHNRNLLQCPLG